MGIIAVAFFFGQRGCTWLPGNRVKSVIAENTIVIGDSVLGLLHCLADDSQPIFDLLNTNGDVDFGGSETHQDQKIYKIDGPNDLAVYFKLFENDNFDSYSEIIDIKSPQINCDITTTNSNKQPLLLPHALIMKIIAAHSFTYYPIIECQLACYDIPNDSLSILHQKAIEIQTPDIPNLINKVYNITTKYNESKYVIQYEIGENRTRIKNIKPFETATKEPCDCE